jgi:hypothetical protein
MRIFSQIMSVALAGMMVVPATVLARADLWVHPRAEQFDPSRHYRDSEGNLYFREENDLGGKVEISFYSESEADIRVDLGTDIVGRAQATGGSLVPVLLYDRNGDGLADQRIKGLIDGSVAVFSRAPLTIHEAETGRWQLGVLYSAGDSGIRELDGRYLASVAGRDSRVAILPPPARANVVEPEPKLPEVGAMLHPPGLVVYKHREGTPFDLAGFEEGPTRYLENFDLLTRAEDGDDWTLTGDRGRLVTHLDEENLFFIRTEGDFDLDVVWGDLAFERFMAETMNTPADGKGCYASTNSELENEDGSRAEPPHRLLYCPKLAFAVFDAPPGYQIGLSAVEDDAVYEYTEASTSPRDNVRLYVQEIYPRSPSSRATGSVGQNVAAGFKDAGGDLKDAFRHLVVGSNERDIHTGRVGYRPSPIVAPFRATWKLLRLQPIGAIRELLAGGETAVQVGADLVSAVDNAVLNPLIQGTVGIAASPGAANVAGDWVGALMQAAVKNLPFGERSNGVIDLRATWYHDRAFDPVRFTRTDTQLNIDRAMTILTWSTLNAIRIHNRSSSSGGGSSSDGGNGGVIPGDLPGELPGDGVPQTPGPPLP